MTAHATTIPVPLVDRIRKKVQTAAELGVSGDVKMFTLDEMADLLEQLDRAVEAVDLNQARVAELRGELGRVRAGLSL